MKKKDKKESSRIIRYWKNALERKEKLKESSRIIWRTAQHTQVAGKRRPWTTTNNNKNNNDNKRNKDMNKP